MNKRGARRLRIVCILVVMTVLTGVLPSVSAAHTLMGKKNFYWYLGSRVTNKDKINDPIDIQWLAGNSTGYPADKTDLRSAVERNWGATQFDGPPPSKQKMLFGSACLFQNVPIAKEKARQDAIFKPDPPDKAKRESNVQQGSTSSHCFTQYHMRFWDDHVHDEITRNHVIQDEWEISGVHQDVSRCTYNLVLSDVGGERFGGCHEVLGNWAAYRAHAMREMHTLCTRDKWKKYPGGDTRIGRKRFDGWIARIEMSNPDGCTKGFR